MPSPTPVVFLALGGVVFSVIYGSSRPWIIQCSDCNEVFKKHSFLSILMQPFFWLYIVVYTCMVIGILFLVGAMMFS